MSRIERLFVFIICLIFPLVITSLGKTFVVSFSMEEWLKPAVVYLSHIIELVGAAVIALALLIFIYRFTVSHLGIKPHSGNIELRVKFGSYLTLVLELLLGADILVTAVAPTWEDIGKLAAIASIRTVLNYFLERDLKSWERESNEEGGINPIKEGIKL
jgi:uncharacterized membrane protein